MTERAGASWFVYALGALCAGAIAAAVLVVGPASGSQANITRTATVAQGVVQSTVSGSGNLQAVSQLNLGFKTSGTVTHIYVTQGEQVAQGQLLATLDPQSAEVSLEQARASLQSAEANLAKEEETDGESSPKGETSTGSSGGAGNASAAPERESRESSSGSSAKTTISAATREANLASARAAVRSDALTVHGDEQAVQNTNLYAPESGTIVSLSGQVGEVVSASGTTRGSSATSSASGSGSSAAAAGSSAATGRSAAGASGASSSSSSSSTAFAVLSDLSSMQLVVPLSESEIGHVKDGQIATVTVEALEGRKLAAHVSEVAILSTSNSGVVSYDVTFKLDQMESGLKPGMSATAEVVVRQAEGINVPTSAISADTVTVVRAAKHVRQRVVTGLTGDSSTIILSGLQVGETVVLPTASITGSSTSSLISRLGSRLGGAGALGGGPGAGAGVFFRGGG
ncbi:MAG TPA: HlyD family efflux transporter periplasmic adaptor subunit [Solirubrobacteraceae bacterium]|nr:HlyD family efflux transporter periplasmic adaptor subunit [Solirubrobacteraceae bacterium]